jgi:hypothetical protein
MQTNIIGICKSDLNNYTFETMLKKQKKIYITISECEKQKLLKLGVKLPIKNNTLIVNFFGKQDITPIFNKLQIFHITFHKLKQNSQGNYKIHLNSFKDYNHL